MVDRSRSSHDRKEEARYRMYPPVGTYLCTSSKKSPAPKILLSSELTPGDISTLIIQLLSSVPLAGGKATNTGTHFVPTLYLNHNTCCSQLHRIKSSVLNSSLLPLMLQSGKCVLVGSHLVPTGFYGGLSGCH